MQPPKTTSPIRGFTLIEILVAISIIAVMAMLSLFTFSSVQRRSRDVKRQSDLKILQGALEQYHADQGYYPLASAVSFGGSGSLVYGSKTYLSRIASDPLNGATGYGYQYIAKTRDGAACSTAITCTTYSLCTRLENLAAGTLCSSMSNLEVTPP